MTEPGTIRFATVDDAPAIAAIYEPIVRHTAISFEIEPPSSGEMSSRIAKVQAFAPWLVCTSEPEVVSYAYATKHRERAAYQWSVEVSAYVRDGCRGSGIGAALYTSLFELLRLQGFCNAYAGITLPNPASVALHSRLGFTTIGVFGKIGFKAGAWHDVLWMHREVAPRDADPEAPTPLPVLLERVDCGPALEKGLSLLRGRSAGRS